MSSELPSIFGGLCWQACFTRGPFCPRCVCVPQALWPREKGLLQRPSGECVLLCVVPSCGKHREALVCFSPENFDNNTSGWENLSVLYCFSCVRWSAWLFYHTYQNISTFQEWMGRCDRYPVWIACSHSLSSGNSAYLEVFCFVL